MRTALTQNTLDILFVKAYNNSSREELFPWSLQFHSVVVCAWTTYVLWSREPCWNYWTLHFKTSILDFSPRLILNQNLSFFKCFKSITFCLQETRSNLSWKITNEYEKIPLSSFGEILEGPIDMNECNLVPLPSYACQCWIWPSFAFPR